MKEDDQYSIAAWMREVAKHLTRLGYEQWLKAQYAAVGDHPANQLILVLMQSSISRENLREEHQRSKFVWISCYDVECSREQLTVTPRPAAKQLAVFKQTADPLKIVMPDIFLGGQDGLAQTYDTFIIHHKGILSSTYPRYNKLFLL